jgi:hypothetical protein
MKALALTMSGSKLWEYMVFQLAVATWQVSVNIVGESRIPFELPKTQKNVTKVQRATVNKEAETRCSIRATTAFRFGKFVVDDFFF